MYEKTKMLFEILKFKILFFTGVIASSSYVVLNYDSFINAFGKFTTLGIIILLYNYGAIGIIATILKINKIEKGLIDELE